MKNINLDSVAKKALPDTIIKIVAGASLTVALLKKTTATGQPGPGERE